MSLVSSSAKPHTITLQCAAFFCAVLECLLDRPLFLPLALVPFSVPWRVASWGSQIGWHPGGDQRVDRMASDATDIHEHMYSLRRRLRDGERLSQLPREVRPVH